MTVLSSTITNWAVPSTKIVVRLRIVDIPRSLSTRRPSPTMRTVPNSLAGVTGTRFPKVMSALSRGDGQDEIWGGSFVGASLQASLVAKVLAMLFAAGATLSALTVILPHPAKANEVGLLVIVANAYLVALVLYTQAGRLPVAGACR